MSAHCQLTGRRPGFGNAISHSHRRTRRRFDPNVQRKRYWLPGEGRYGGSTRRCTSSSRRRSAVAAASGRPTART